MCVYFSVSICSECFCKCSSESRFLGMNNLFEYVKTCYLSFDFHVVLLLAEQPNHFVSKLPVENNKNRYIGTHD